MWIPLSVDVEAKKLLRLKKVTQEYDSRKKDLSVIWENMQNFAQGLRNEMDDMYWSEHKIAFEDLESVPEFNQYRFKYRELEKIFDITHIKTTLELFRELHKEKESLESDLGVSMDRKS